VPIVEDRSSGRECEIGMWGGIDSWDGIVIGVPARGCDARPVSTAFLLLAMADGGLVDLPLGEAIELEPLVLALELPVLLQLRMTVGLMIGNGSRGRNNGEQWIHDMLSRIGFFQRRLLRILYGQYRRIWYQVKLKQSCARELKKCSDAAQLS